ncbi:hypothetical protein NA57DRAFT_75695 [Rhizodiscina lignyota]|uniref:C2H2-type domain-containing protein n=1 Tax=Rhizodiscina lignyota TaxID=1504668 RepID=A0A9P4IBC4_9PEZI|nr:hypothetical protein NA57DRAFT_75695 [Rhizodiscina lignyota]
MESETSSSYAGDCETISSYSHSQSYAWEPYYGHGNGVYGSGHWPYTPATSAPSNAHPPSAYNSPRIKPQHIDPTLLDLNQTAYSESPGLDNYTINQAQPTIETTIDLGLPAEQCVDPQLPAATNAQIEFHGNLNQHQHGEPYNPAYSNRFPPAANYSGRVDVAQDETDQLIRPGDGIGLADSPSHAVTPSPSTHSAVPTGPNGVSVCTCGKQYKRNSELTRHIKQKTEGPQHICGLDNCGRAFNDLKDLFRHQSSQKHGNVRFFRCKEEGCIYASATHGFSRRDNFMRHMDDQHGIRVPRKHEK